MRTPENNQMNFEDIAVQEILKKDRFYQPLLKLVDFHSLMKPFHDIYSNVGCPGYPIETGIKCLLVQVFEDKSDRQMEELLTYDVRIRYFCGFRLSDTTPDHSYFSRFRERLGAENLKEIHNRVVEILTDSGLVGGFCSFVDTSDIVRKNNVWTERDKKIEQDLKVMGLGRDLIKKEPLKKKEQLKKETELNNSNVSEYSSDPDARIGCKGKKKYWFGYKRGICVDGRFGIITKVAVKPANVPDHHFASELYPESGAVLMDKGFDVDRVLYECPDGVTARVIRKRNRRDKNYDLDRWISSLRSPFEATFSHLKKKTYYVGLLKNCFKGYIEAIAYNLKKTLKIQEIYPSKFAQILVS